jgi:Integral membrane protein TerC family
MRCTTWPTSRRGAWRAARQCRRLSTRALRRGGHNDWFFTSEAAVAFIQVVAIDLVLAGDNAVVIGLAAAGLPPQQRMRAILVGILAPSELHSQG